VREQWNALNIRVINLSLGAARWTESIHHWTRWTLAAKRAVDAGHRRRTLRPATSAGPQTDSRSTARLDRRANAPWVITGGSLEHEHGTVIPPGNDHPMAGFCSRGPTNV
jgi:hypothetical protein